MITRAAKVRELLIRTLPDGSESCSASVSFDEASCTTLRLSRSEHDEIASAMRGGNTFVVCLRVAPATVAPKASRLARELTDGSGGSS